MPRSVSAPQAESRGQRMREVEPAHVTALHYVISNDGSSNTCARLTLCLSDPASPLLGRAFDVELPPATNGHAEFVIPKHRFLTSVRRMWGLGDLCQVQPGSPAWPLASCCASLRPCLLSARQTFPSRLYSQALLSFKLGLHPHRPVLRIYAGHATMQAGFYSPVARPGACACSAGAAFLTMPCSLLPSHCTLTACGAPWKKMLATCMAATVSWLAS